ncbi:hypothetical protein ACG2LH_04475 [Zhouia sp. PK063]|uniref:hypothetical protein n=1 Tax=Zhouia sp. PK063 TaxID=3373602 RepID=UPI00378A8D33
MEDKVSKNRLFISCEEAKHICDKCQYDEASFIEKLKLKLRTLWCGAARSYSKNNSKLSSCVTSAKVKCMDEKKKQALKEELSKKLSE